MTTDNKAADIVTGAKQWAGQYGAFSNGREGAVLTAVLRCRAAWDAGDADSFTDMFIDNGSMLVGDEQLTDREAIRAYMTAALNGPLKGTRLVESPREIKLVTPEVAIAVTEGGVAAPGEAEPDPADVVRATWVAVKKDGDWRIASHQTCPIHS
jgi:uncharacterized protein (TIGR02246 family)